MRLPYILAAVLLFGSSARAQDLTSVFRDLSQVMRTAGGQDASADVARNDSNAASASLSSVVTITSPESWSCRFCEPYKAQDWSNEPYTISEAQSDDMEQQLRLLGYRGPWRGYPVTTWTGGDGKLQVLFGKYTPSQVTASWRESLEKGDALKKAAQSPTPYSVIAEGLGLAKLQPGESLVDLGCGDGRVLMVAVEEFRAGSAKGVEIDPERAAQARRMVEASGLKGIEVQTGDATRANLSGDVAYVYLYPETLGNLRTTLEQFDRVVSYQHKIPGLSGQVKKGDFWLWEKPRASQSAAQEPQRGVAQAGRPYAIYQGRKYYSANGNCGCGMCQNIRWQIATRQHVEPVAQTYRYCPSCRRRR